MTYGLLEGTPEANDRFSSSSSSAPGPAVRIRARKKCSVCKEEGHTKRTCPQKEPPAVVEIAPAVLTGEIAPAVMWCGVVWCSVVWCSVVWCGVV